MKNLLFYFINFPEAITLLGIIYSFVKWKLLKKKRERFLMFTGGLHNSLPTKDQIFHIVSKFCFYIYVHMHLIGVFFLSDHWLTLKISTNRNLAIHK